MRIDASIGAASEPALAIDPNNPDHIVVAYHDYQNEPGSVRLHISVSTDGGMTWTDSVLPLGAEVPPDHPLATYTLSGDPSLTWIPDGSLVMQGIALRGAYFDGYHRELGGFGSYRDFALFVTRSTDGGLSWDEPTILVEGEGDGSLPAAQSLPDRPKIASGTELVVSAWPHNINNHPDHPETINNDTQSIRMAISEDQGATWSPPVELFRKPYGESHVTVYPVVRGKVLHVAAARPVGEGYQMTVATTTDLGVTWDVVELGPAPFNKQPLPDRLIDPEGARVAYAELKAGPASDPNSLDLAYTRMTNTTHHQPVLQRSVDGGATWDDPILLDDPVPSGYWLHPTVSVVDNGTFVTYYVPADGGSETVRSVFVTSEGTVHQVPGFAPDISPGIYKRDYMASTPRGDGVMAAWTGGYEPDAGIYIAAIGWERNA